MTQEIKLLNGVVKSYSVNENDSYIFYVGSGVASDMNELCETLKADGRNAVSYLDGYCGWVVRVKK